MSSLNLTPFLKKVLKPAWGGTRNKTHGSPDIHTGIVHRGVAAFCASRWPAHSIKNRPNIVNTYAGLGAEKFAPAKLFGARFGAVVLNML
jgi:hypothetical protein